ncbi:MAG: T9SS type A sorting domain-containing protein [Bacteroidota bacterium]|nr:T9SS type A sorting domain-containing protein [Bacteroidota bacterium]
MKNKITLIVCLLLTASFTMFGQMIKRTDAIWARVASGPITLDGKLNEPDWAKADSIVVMYGKDPGMPGSGYNTDGWPIAPTDPIHATMKFLVSGDSLYVGVVCNDSSIGGGDWPGPAKWDGMLGAILDKSSANRPMPRKEIFYGWVATTWADSTLNQPGKLPGYFGAYGGSRTDSVNGVPKWQIWDAKTTVKGTTNDDESIDTSWTTEFKFNLKYFGYDPTGAAGDIVAWNTSIYDADWQWFKGADTVKNRFNINKAWVQGQWGGGDSYNSLRILVRPDVTVNSGTAPTVNADMVIPGAGSYGAPVIDGKLDEPIWSNPNIGTLKLKYGDNTIRSAYPGTLSYTSGQFQPQVNGGMATITDPNDATIKWFYKGDTLYLGFDVKDKVVQSIPSVPDRWDGFRITLNDRGARNGDSVEITRNFTFIIDSVGGAMRMEDLGKAGWDSLGKAVTVAAKVQGTVDTMATTADTGYTAEMKIDLSKLGYPSNRGDGVVFLGATMFDGDSYGAQYTKSYGSRVWFARESAGRQQSAWLWMDPNTVLTGVAQSHPATPVEFRLFGNYPNPFNPSTTIKFSMSKASNVKLEVFDILGRLVASQDLGVRQAGIQEAEFDGARLASGVYTYRLRTSLDQTAVGRMVLLK